MKKNKQVQISYLKSFQTQASSLSSSQRIVFSSINSMISDNCEDFFINSSADRFPDESSLVSVFFSASSCSISASSDSNSLFSLNESFFFFSDGLFFGYRFPVCCFFAPLPLFSVPQFSIHGTGCNSRKVLNTGVSMEYQQVIHHLP